MCRRLLPALLFGLLALAPGLSGCRSSDLLGNAAGGAVGALGGDQRLGDIARVVAGSPLEQVQQINVQFTPEQEYYLGRAVAAHAIARYGLDPDEGLQAYVRTLGHAIVALSARVPATFGGWTFAVLGTSEVNGVSGPGGFVMVTRGAVDACRNEAELAGILAHEIAHVSLRHGESTIRKGKTFQSAVGTLGRIAAAAAGANDQGYASGLVKFFGDAVGEASRTAVEHSYGRDAEFAADREAVYLLYDTGYDGSAMKAVLAMLASHGDHGGATHAPASERAAAVDRVSATYGGFQDLQGEPAREARFRAAVHR